MSYACTYYIYTHTHIHTYIHTYIQRSRRRCASKKRIRSDRGGPELVYTRHVFVDSAFKRELGCHTGSSKVSRSTGVYVSMHACMYVVCMYACTYVVCMRHTDFDVNDALPRWMGAYNCFVHVYVCVYHLYVWSLRILPTYIYVYAIPISMSYNAVINKCVSLFHGVFSKHAPCALHTNTYRESRKSVGRRNEQINKQIQACLEFLHGTNSEIHMCVSQRTDTRELQNGFCAQTSTHIQIW